MLQRSTLLQSDMGHTGSRGPTVPGITILHTMSIPPALSPENGVIWRIFFMVVFYLKFHREAPGANGYLPKIEGRH